MDTISSTWFDQHKQGLHYIVGIACGFAIHHGLLRHGEWHVQAPYILILHVVVINSFNLLMYVADKHFQQVLDAACAIFWAYLQGLVLSTLIYRVFFHRLTRAGFPGPWYAPMWKLWHVWQSRTGQNHIVLDRLHKKYGDVVRTGPAEVTVFTPDVYLVTDGPRSQCVKSEFYDLLSGLGYPSLVNTRDNMTHNTRRREWRPGFSKESMDAYRIRISTHLDELVKIIDDDVVAGNISAVREYMYWFGFDAMGEFVFSKPFDMLKKRQPSIIIERLQNALSLLGPLTPTPWLLHIGLKLAPHVGVIKDWFDTLEFCRTSMARRLVENQQAKAQEEKHPNFANISPVTKDLAYHLLEDEHYRKATSISSVEVGRNWNMSWLTGDSLLAIVAGSDPTTVTLIGAFAEMAKHPEHAEILYNELANADITDFSVLSTLPHLNAIIKEVMRLYPSLLSGGSRKTLDQPVTIGGRVIPPYTTIVSPRFTINRSKSYTTYIFDSGTMF